MSTQKRMEFKGGWWADVRTAWSYGADSRIAGAWAYADNGEGFQNAAIITLQESVINAHLPDTDGNVVPFGPDMWETVNGKIGRKILIACRDSWGAWQADSDPKDTSEKFSESQPESQHPSQSE